MRSDPDYEIIVEMFRERCVHCNRVYNVIHEMLPRSSGKNAMKIDNRVPLCYNCHDWAHSVGTNVSMPVLVKDRERALKRYATKTSESDARKADTSRSVG